MHKAPGFCPQLCIGQALECTPETPTLGRWRQEYLKFKAFLGYMRLCVKKSKKKSKIIKKIY